MSALVDRLLPFRRYLLERNLDPEKVPPLAFRVSEMRELANEMQPFPPTEPWDFRPGTEAKCCGFKGVVVRDSPE